MKKILGIILVAFLLFVGGLNSSFAQNSTGATTGASDASEGELSSLIEALEGGDEAPIDTTSNEDSLLGNENLEELFEEHENGNTAPSIPTNNGEMDLENLANMENTVEDNISIEGPNGGELVDEGYFDSINDSNIEVEPNTEVGNVAVEPNINTSPNANVDTKYVPSGGKGGKLTPTGMNEALFIILALLFTTGIFFWRKRK